MASGLQHDALREEVLDRELGRVGREILEPRALIAIERGLHHVPDRVWLDAWTRPQPQRKPGPAVRVQRFGIHRRRNEHVRHEAWLGADESRGSHAHDLVGIPVDLDCRPDDARIAGEPLRPAVVTENRYRMCAGRSSSGGPRSRPADG